MSPRHADGSAGDADYGAIGIEYATYRRPDPRIAAVVADALGDARTVLNVGAGTGSYEPVDRDVTAVEPSATMRAQRPAGLPAAIDATAEALPFADASFDAAMATYSVHQWSDWAAGLREMRRVTTGPIVILTGDPVRVEQFWLARYAPTVLAHEARRYPPPQAMAAALGGTSTVTQVPIPLDCTDGFIEAYYGRPEMLLDPAARRCCSAWSFVGPDEVASSIESLRGALRDGTWEAEFGDLRTRPAFTGSLVLLVNRPDPIR